jgi:hypothetical protein
MIQLNLLPDVKLEYIKADRSRRLVMTIAFFSTVAAVVLLLILFSASVYQKKHVSDLSKSIDSVSLTLQAKPGINTVLTVQNQLLSLTNLHNQKPAASKLFGFINSVTPSNVSINNLSIDFNLFTISILGSSDKINSVNKYIDTLKQTTYTSSTNTNAIPAFSNVVLSSFSVSGGTNPAQVASYGVTFAYDRNIFDITQDIKLTVASITTHDQQSSAADLFKAQTTGVKP